MDLELHTRWPRFVFGRLIERLNVAAGWLFQRFYKDEDQGLISLVTLPVTWCSSDEYGNILFVCISLYRRAWDRFWMYKWTVTCALLIVKNSKVVWRQSPQIDSYDLCKIIEDRVWWHGAFMNVWVCASGTSVCLCVSTGMPTIFRKLFGISGAVHPSSAEKNQTVEYRSLPREKCSSAK